MDYQRFNQDILLRVDVGEELMESVEKVVKEESIALATVSGIGALKSTVLGIYDVKERTYDEVHLDEFMEMSALLGNITTKEGTPYLHLHVTLGNRQGQGFAGHLKKGVVGGTAEILIHVLEGSVERKVCEKTGINIFDFLKD